MKIQNSKKTVFWTVAALCVLLGIVFVPECDDLYFSYFRFDSLWDFLLVKPNNMQQFASGIPQNGRYLGNVLGVVLAKLYQLPGGFLLHGLIIGLILFALCVLLSRYGQSSEGNHAGRPLVFACLLLLLAPQALWREVISWNAAFVNYLIPAIGILLCLHFEKKRERSVLCAIVCFLCCSFLEPVTIAFLLYAALCLLYRLLCRKNIKFELLMLLGSALGFCLMFLTGAYAARSGDIQASGLLGRVPQTADWLCYQSLLRPWPLTLLLSAGFICSLKKQNVKGWRRCGWGLLAVHLLQLLLLLCVEAAKISNGWTRCLSVFCGALLLVCWGLLLWRLEDGKRKRVTRLFLFAALSVCPLFVLQTQYQRTLFPCYLLMAAAAQTLWSDCPIRAKAVKWLLPVAAASLFVAHLFLYSVNFAVYTTRLQYAQAAAAAGQTEITLPLLPFPNWSANEHEGKQDIAFIVYHESVGDIHFSFFPYAQFDFSQRESY